MMTFTELRFPESIAGNGLDRKLKDMIKSRDVLCI